MSHLLLVSLGPIQDFISAARKAQDLWFGSWLLSDLARAAAQELNTHGAALIFPESLTAASPNDPPSVANKLIAVVPGDAAKVRDVAEKGRAAMVTRLEEHAKRAFDQAEKRARSSFHRETAEAQVRDLMEYVWVAVPHDPARYAKDLESAERELASLKQSKLWAAVSWDGAGIPKSSVDGLRESVFDEALFDPRRDNADTQRMRAQLHLKKSERICGVGYLKRRGASDNDDGGRERPVFHSASHVAAAPLRMRYAGMSDADRGAVDEAFGEYTGALRRLDVTHADVRVRGRAANLAGTTNTRLPWEIKGRSESASPASSQLFEGEQRDGSSLLSVDNVALFTERLDELVEDATGRKPVPGNLNEARAKLQALLGALGSTEDSLPSYYALLLADGDNMGMFLDAVGKAPGGIENHQRVSKNLVTFANDALRIVVRHGGSPVYTGGDDVLAFVPLSTALACAEALRLAFANQVAEGAPKVEATNPTLSVGLAVVHHLEALSSARALAKRAENLAKKHNGKNALGIVVQPRSGSTKELVGSWEPTGGGGNLHARMDAWAKHLLDGHVSRKLPHDLAAALRPFAGQTDAKYNDLRATLARGIVSHKRDTGERAGDEKKKLYEELEKRVADVVQGGDGEIERLATELEVAWLFAKSYEIAFDVKRKGQ